MVTAVLVASRPPPLSVDPAGEITVHGEDGSEEAQEGEGGAGRYQDRSLHVRGGSEALDQI